MTSCATIINQPYKYVTLHTTEPSNIILGQDTIETIDNKVHLKVERKKELSPSIFIITDSLTKSIRIESKNSFMYWSNLLNCGIGMLVDMKNPKRYSYPDKIYVNSTNKSYDYSIHGKANNKGELYLHLSPPFSLSVFKTLPENENIRINIGIESFALGFDYYHSKNQFVHLGGSYILGIGGAPFSGVDEYTNSYAIFFSNNHKLWRFSIGYGLSYAKNTWEYKKTEWKKYTIWGVPNNLLPVIVKHVVRDYNAFGLIFPTYFQVGEYFNVGVVYRPTFFRPNMTDKFAYEHIINIDFAWKIRLKK